jgi:hypothetical protein
MPPFRCRMGEGMSFIMGRRCRIRAGFQRGRGRAGGVALTDWGRPEVYACHMTKLAIDITEHRYKRHRFPTEIIAHAVWLYHRFPLSLRDVEDLLAERGIDVSFQTVSEWAANLPFIFAGDHAAILRTNGISTRWLCPSRERNTGCGAPSMPAAMFSTPSCKAGGTRKPLFDRCESC